MNELIIQDLVNAIAPTVSAEEHRKYVGDYWDQVATEAMTFLRGEGMCTYHNVLDIGCGSLRIGHELIKFLDYDKYSGIDHHRWLIEAGLEKELEPVDTEKRPIFVVSDNFDFKCFNRKFDYAIAKSVFTHLTKDKISQCLNNLKDIMSPDGSFYATIFLGRSSGNPEESNDTKRFCYDLETITELADGWNVVSLGNTVGNKQTMLRFTLKRTDFKVSIITAAFRGELMPRVWESIKSQDFTNWEWVIVNDNQDSVRQWYREAQKNNLFEGKDVWFIDLERQMGRFGLYSRNIGAMVAKYDRVAFLDDDNEWMPDHLSSLINLEIKTGKIPYCWMRVIGKKPGSTFQKTKRTHFGRQGIDLGCILYRKIMFEKYGYFPDSRLITFDFDLMRKIFSGEGQSNFACTDKDSLRFHHKRY
jgi:ubiquinone/menaquinone biosynthesis C-methylase UbiE